MKIVGAAVALSIALNIWVLWQLQDVAQPDVSAAPEYSHASPDVAAVSSKGALPQTEPPGAKDELAELNERLSSLEALLEALQQRLPDQSIARHRELATEAQRLRKGAMQAGAGGSDDWFWNAQDSGEPDTTQSIPDGESYTVQSLVCRSDWCRAEIQLDDAVLEDPEMELELQLELSESLGRDVELSYGKRTGNNQVVFIRSP